MKIISVCHKHEIRLIISIRMKMGERVAEKKIETGSRETKGDQKKKNQAILCT